MKKTYAILIFLLASTLLLAQNKNLTYIGDIYSISRKQAADKKSETHYSVEKGYHHILIFKDKKAIMFRQDSILGSIDSVPKTLSDYKFLSLYDRKSSSVKYISARYNEKNDRVYTNEQEFRIWQKITPDKKPDLTGTEEEWIKSLYKQFDSIPKWEAPIYQYSDSVKTIHGFSCKNVNVRNGQREYNVWFTEEINYNWCFDDYCYLIPGTVIYIEYDNKPYLEFVSLEDLDYDQLPLNKKIVKEVLRKWNK